MTVLLAMSSPVVERFPSGALDDEDFRAAALEIAAQGKLQRERDLRRHTTASAETKLRQCFLQTIEKYHGPDVAISNIIADASATLALPVRLWSPDDVKRTWDALVVLERERAAVKVSDSPSPSGQASEEAQGEASVDDLADL